MYYFEVIPYIKAPVETQLGDSDQPSSADLAGIGVGGDPGESGYGADFVERSRPSTRQAFG